ncbi:MAG: hypothetical protein Q4G33_13960 [bacterium]|nr:hypothetical protein [bacterium]
MDQVSLVKSDVRKNQWVEIIQACQSSGMTVKAWCAQNGINIKSYYYRLRKLSPAVKCQEENEKTIK